jgi:DNA replication protein DnaC
MLAHPTHERLIALGLPGMAKAFEDQRRSPDIAALSFEERIGLMVDREAAERDTKRLATRLKFAALRQNAVVEDVDLRTPRGIDRALFQKLVAGDWIDRAEGLLITGPTGVGKSWIACALGHKACRMGEASSTIGRRACSRPWRSPAAMAATAACSKPSLASSS